MEFLLKNNYVPADPSPQGIRYCTNCGLNRNSVGGYWKIINKGNQRRWVCKPCTEIKFK